DGKRVRRQCADRDRPDRDPRQRAGGGENADRQRAAARHLPLPDLPGGGVERLWRPVLPARRTGRDALDEPARIRPDVHIYTRSKQPWLALPPDVPAFEVFYEMAEQWPPAALARRKAAADAARQN